MATRYAGMAVMQKTIIKLRGEINTLKSKLSGQATKKPDKSGYKKGNWWSNPYFCTHGVISHGVETCFKKSDGHKGKSTSLNRMNVSKKGIP